MTGDPSGHQHGHASARRSGLKAPPSPVDAWRWARNRTLPLLVALVLLLALHPIFVLEGGGVSDAFPLALSFVPLLGVAALRSWERAMPLVVVFVAMTTWSGFAYGFDSARTAGSPIEILAFLYYLSATVLIGATLLSSRSLLDDRVYGGLAVYLLAGCTFAALHRYLSATDPEAYWTTVQQRGIVLNWDGALYYSFTALTTVGFGDLVPRSPPARAATMLEAISGVFLTVVFIARVGAVAFRKDEGDAGRPAAS